MITDAVQPSAFGTTTAAVTASVAAAMPIWFVGGFAVLIQEDLALSDSALGLAVGLYFIALALTSVPAGSFAGRRGARRSMLLASSVSGIVMLFAGLIQGPLQLTVLLICAGFATALCQPSGNALLAHGVPLRYHGIAFAIRQSAVPAAGLLAGVAIPGLALQVGWRLGLGISACLTLALLGTATLATRGPRAALVVEPEKFRTKTELPMGVLMMLASGVGLASMATGSSQAFLVISLVQYGWDLSTAGFVLALGSVTCIAGRLLAGYLVDRWNLVPLVIMAFMLAIGAAGFVAIGLGTVRVLTIFGVMLGFGAGWGWPGVLNLALVRVNPSAPARVTGIVLTGMAVGAAVGPIVFGATADFASYRAAWLIMASGTFVAAVIVTVSYICLNGWSLSAGLRADNRTPRGNL